MFATFMDTDQYQWDSTSDLIQSSWTLGKLFSGNTSSTQFEILLNFISQMPPKEPVFSSLYS